MDILARICATKRAELAEAEKIESISALEERASAAPPPRDFTAALRAAQGRGGRKMKLIAEIKKASPSVGLIREDFDPRSLSREYASAGADCLSILTDRSYFQGDLSFLSDVRGEVPLPLLRKDFILHRRQILEARAAGADAVLLIAECLDEKNLKELYEETLSWKMTPLVELYEGSNVARVVALGAQLIGINNRDLKTFQVDLLHCVRLRQQIPADRIVVAESGIRSAEEVSMLEEKGLGAMLVGESLMRQKKVGEAVRALLGK